MTRPRTAPTSELRAMARLAAPLAIQQVGFHAMGLVDAAMLGRYSDAALAGAGVGNALVFGITCVGLGIVMGMDTVVPQAIGAGRIADARRAIGAGVRLAILVGLIATLAVFGSPALLAIADVEPDVIDEARAYVYMRALGVVPFLITVALRSFLAAHGRTRPLVIAVLIGNAVNALLDLALIFGIEGLGIPALGVVGAATATTAVQIVTIAVYVLGVRAIEASYAASGDDRRARRPRSTAADLRAIARFGLPVGGQLLAEVGMFGLSTILAAHLGKLAAGAHTIAINLSSFTFSFALGISSATSVRVGLAAGAGDLALARRRGLLGLQLGLVVMGCFAAAFLLVPGVLARAITSSSALAVATVPLLQIAALFQLSDGAQAIGAGALRGLGHTRTTLVGNLIGHYALGLPVMVVLAFELKLGAPGLWWGLSAGLTATAAFLVWRFYLGTGTGADRTPA
jgi:multidrug resistance protein, MATE family